MLSSGVVRRVADFKGKAPAASFNTFLLVPILLLFGLLTIAVLRSPHLLSSAGIGSAVIVVAPLVLATYALMSVAIAGRATVDLSVGPLIGFINVTLIQLHAADYLSSPLAVFVYALAVGIAYQLVMGVIILFVRVQPIIVALSGFLALSGINLVVMSRPGGAAPDWMMPWGAGTSILSAPLIILLIATAGWLIFAHTAFFSHMRLMGADERAAYTSGVRIYIVRLGAHVISGIFSALAAITFTALIGSGDPTQGTTYTLIAVTALVLGGTSLAGGRGGVTGSLLGALNIYLIGYVLSTFSFGSVQGFVTDLAYGVILVASLLLAVGLPLIQRYIRSISPYMVFMVLALAFTSVALHMTYDYSRLAGLAAPSTAVEATSVPRSAVASESDAGVPPETAGTGNGAPEKVTTEISPSAEALVTVQATASAEAIGKVDMALTPRDESVKTADLVTAAGPDLAKFIFEFASIDSQPGQSTIAKSVTYAAILLLCLVAFLRIAVAQLGRQKMTPVAFIMIASLVVLAAYFLATSSTLPPVTASLSEGTNR